MTRSASKFASAALVAASLLAPAAASAQEAIMLETIGAVRMAAPEEVQRTNATHDRSTSDRQVVRAATAEIATADR